MMKSGMMIAMVMALAAAGQIRPNVEGWPAGKYVAPATPGEKARREAEEGSNRVARARHQAAVRELAVSIGAPTGTAWRATAERARMFEELAKKKKK